MLWRRRVAEEPNELANLTDRLAPYFPDEPSLVPVVTTVSATDSDSVVAA